MKKGHKEANKANNNGNLQRVKNRAMLARKRKKELRQLLIERWNCTKKTAKVIAG